MYVGHCTPCTRGVACVLRDMEMLDGHVAGMYPKLFHNNDAVYIQEPNEYSYAYIQVAMQKEFNAEAKQKRLEMKQKQRKERNSKKTKVKSEVSDFLSLAGL